MLEITSLNEDTWIAIQSGGYYGNACISKGFMAECQSCVVGYKQFLTFINDGEPTRPIFISSLYTVCIAVAGALNDSASEISFKKFIAEQVRS